MSGRGAARVEMAAMLRLIDLTDYIVPHTIRAAATLGVADALEEGPLPVAALAARVGADGAALRRAMRALACTGLFVEDPDGVFGLTDAARPLLTHEPGSVVDRLRTHPVELYTWAQMHEVVRTGSPAFAEVSGREYHEHLRADPVARRHHALAGAATAREDLDRVFAAVAWPAVTEVVDIAASSADLVAALETRAPHARVVTADAGTAAEPATGAEAGAVPPGADVYLLRRVLHTVPDPAGLLARVAGSASPQSRVVVVDPVRGTDAGRREAHLADIVQLVFTGGRVHTPAGLRALVTGAGLSPESVTTDGGVALVVASGPAAGRVPPPTTGSDREVSPA